MVGRRFHEGPLTRYHVQSSDFRCSLGGIDDTGACVDAVMGGMTVTIDQDKAGVAGRRRMA